MTYRTPNELIVLEKLNVCITAYRVEIRKIDIYKIECASRLEEIESNYKNTMAGILNHLTDEEKIVMYSKYHLMRRYLKPFLSKEIVSAGLIIGS